MADFGADRRPSRWSRHQNYHRMCKKKDGPQSPDVHKKGGHLGKRGGERDAGSRHPQGSLNEGHGLEREGHSGVADLLGPPHALGEVGSAGAQVLPFCEVGRPQAEIGGVPGQPAGGIDVAHQGALEVDVTGVGLPWASQVRLEVGLVGFELRRCVEYARLEGQARGLVGVGLALRRVRVLLPEQRRFLGDNSAGLEGDGAVAEDEVDCAQDCALAVELAECVRVERVLPAIEGAEVERRHVRAHAQRHRLVTNRARRVAGLEGLADESGAFDNCSRFDANGY